MKPIKHYSPIEAMLKRALKQMKQRTEKILAKHASETMAATVPKKV